MKTNLSKFIISIATVVLTTTTAFVQNQNEVSAAKIATVNPSLTAKLYTKQGSLITNRALASNTPWLVGDINIINGQTMYQVATNEYLQASDSTFKDTKSSHPRALVGKVQGGDLRLFDSKTNSMSDRSLADGTSWLINKHIYNKLGQHFVQVSTYEYADATKMTYNAPVTKAIYFGNFGTDLNQTDDSLIKESTTPNLSAIQMAVINDINNERLGEGLFTLTTDSKLARAASLRAQENNQLTGNIRPNGQSWYTSYSEVGITNPEELYSHENNFSFNWYQLSTKTPQNFADTMINKWHEEKTLSDNYDELISPVFTKIGVGTYYNANTKKVIVSVEFTN
ncbi:CAP domain-containing protein [Companilactobacillus sp. HBUAS59544]|uniref:CAP domain-containing protein n=1 Tax=Companilactobacillus sp. HBUAS59544 TaxID=3109363 RepID=UPI002FF0D284